MSSIQRDMSLMDAHIKTINYRNLRRIDWVLFGLTALLAAIGIAALYSASQSASSEVPVYLKYYFKQVVFLAMGFTIALIIVCIDYRALVSLAPLFFVGVIGLLIAVLFWGTSAKGGQHWLRFGLIGIQPSELSKLALVYMLAWYLSAVRERIQKLFYFCLAFAIMGVLLALILAQKDLGTALVLIPVVIVTLFAAGARKRHLLVPVLAGLVMIPFVFLHVEKLPLSEHQKKRLTSFFHPEKDAKESGYHIIQTKIAVGSGQMWGKGFGKGTQTHLRFLPEYHTDFIFALLAEEKGFIGASVVVGLFALFLLRGLALARDCPDLAGSLLAVGCVTVLGFHILSNIAITLHLMPITGLPLPFLSYGGSFCLTAMMCVGTMLSVHVRKGFFD